MCKMVQQIKKNTVQMDGYPPNDHIPSGSVLGQLGCSGMWGQRLFNSKLYSLFGSGHMGNHNVGHKG